MYVEASKLLFTDGVDEVGNGMYKLKIYVIARLRGKFRVIEYTVGLFVIEDDDVIRI